MKLKAPFKIASILIVCLLVANIIYAHDSTSITVPATGQLRYSRWPITSVCMFPYDDYYSQAGTDIKLDEIRQRLPEVNYIEIRTYWKPDPSNSNNMTYTGGDIGYLGTPVNSWGELEAAVAKIRSRNIDVILWACKYWGAENPNPTNVTIWLQNYGTYAQTVALWAQAQRIPIFVFGAEYDSLVPDYSILGSKYSTEWSRTIAQIRAVYSGKVVYGFNWWYEPLHWETIYNQASWISDLDFIQIDSFVSLGKNVYDNIDATEIAKWWNPTVADLVGNWTHSRFGSGWNYVQMYEQLSTKYGKKILIDIGYRNNNGTNTFPWANTYMHDMYGNDVPGWGPDVKELNDCWEAFFSTWGNSTAIVGVDMEHYSQANTNDLDGSFRNKYDSTTSTYTWQTIHRNLIPSY